MWETCDANSHGVYVDGHQVMLHACSMSFIERMLLLLMLLLLLHLTIIEATCSPTQKQ